MKYAKRPPSYGTQLNKAVNEQLLFAVILHILVGVYMYGQPLIFPKSASSISDSVSSNTPTTDTGNF